MSRNQEKKKGFFSCCAGDDDKKDEAYVDLSEKRQPVYSPPRNLFFTQPYLFIKIAASCQCS